jgi:hypothetical protein
MKTVKVTFENGETLVTGINGTHDEIVQYYMGQLFTMANEQTAKVVRVEFL